MQVGITDIGELFESDANQSESDIKSVRQDDMHILIKYSNPLYQDQKKALMYPRQFMRPESEELFALYLQLQSADSQFLELIEEDLERKQQVLALLNQSNAWLNLAKILQG